MKETNITATTVKLQKNLYGEFKILGIRRRMTLQDFVERAVYLFVKDEEWRNNFNGKFSPSGSINLDIFDKNYTGSILQ
jgi:hypothetical protein